MEDKIYANIYEITQPCGTADIYITNTDNIQEALSNYIKDEEIEETSIHLIYSIKRIYGGCSCYLSSNLVNEVINGEDNDSK